MMMSSNNRWCRAVALGLGGALIVTLSPVSAQAAPKPPVVSVSPPTQRTEQVDAGTVTQTADLPVVDLPRWQARPIKGQRSTEDVTVGEDATAGDRVKVHLAPGQLKKTAAATAHRKAPQTVRARVQVLDTAAAARVPGAAKLVTVTADPDAAGAQVDVSVPVDEVQDSLGAGWTGELVALPGCAATTPDKPGCLTPTRLATTVSGSRLSASVELQAATYIAPGRTYFTLAGVPVRTG